VTDPCARRRRQHDGCAAGNASHHSAKDRKVEELQVLAEHQNANQGGEYIEKKVRDPVKGNNESKAGQECPSPFRSGRFWRTELVRFITKDDRFGVLIHGGQTRLEMPKCGKEFCQANAEAAVAQPRSGGATKGVSVVRPRLLTVDEVNAPTIFRILSSRRRRLRHPQ
jgi:hypothetical protein